MIGMILLWKYEMRVFLFLDLGSSEAITFDNKQ